MTTSQDCYNSWKAAFDAENDLHKQNLDNCGTDSECRSAEYARHTARVNELQTQYETCLINATDAGGGDNP